ncbi:MAG: hypothetical protein ICV87_02660 [Gemmatimonadetes bacterium]|nr:hypothetical protein [Gemmatimonadota bacterium]
MLLESAKLERVEFSDDQIVGLWGKAIEAYTDSSSRPRSWNGQFRDLYESGRLAATAVVAAAGFRAKGTDHHRSVITAAAELSPEEVAEAFYAVEGARGNRHDTNYGSADVVDEGDVAEIREALGVLMAAGAKHLRSTRPSAKARIRVTHPGKRQEKAPAPD